MTGAELRQKVANTINAWLGAVQGSATHKAILAIYNGHKPLAAGYTMPVSAPWCAATVSAAWIKAGIAEYTGTECSCPRFITVAKGKGYWVEADNHVPQVGDAVLYDWSDGASYASYDSTGEPDHIGLVVAVSGRSFTVTEGNMSSKVGQRTMQVNGRYIRGFICPDYDAIAKKLGGAQETASGATYEVQSGDTLSSIAGKYGTTWQALAECNGIQDPDRIYVGELIEIPAQAVQVSSAGRDGNQYRNGDTDMPVYADTCRQIRIGWLNPGEVVDCLGTTDGMYAVQYLMDDGSGHKIGYVS